MWRIASPYPTFARLVLTAALVSSSAVGEPRAPSQQLAYYENPDTRFHLTIAEVAALNGIKDPDHFRAHGAPAASHATHQQIDSLLALGSGVTSRAVRCQTLGAYAHNQALVQGGFQVCSNAAPI
jgi:hypothetical protein